MLSMVHWYHLGAAHRSVIEIPISTFSWHLFSLNLTSNGATICSAVQRVADSITIHVSRPPKAAGHVDQLRGRRIDWNKGANGAPTAVYSMVTIKKPKKNTSSTLHVLVFLLLSIHYKCVDDMERNYVGSHITCFLAVLNWACTIT